MQPEAITSDFEAPHNGRVRRQSKPLLRHVKFSLQRIEITRRCGWDPRRLCWSASAESELSRRIAEIHRER
jgi:hypothetical protein